MSPLVAGNLATQLDGRPAWRAGRGKEQTRRSGALPRWIAARAVALLLTVGVLLVGVSAWASDSTQAAGLYRDVQLTVVNKSKHTVRVSVCDGATYTGSHCPEFHNYDLAPGKKAWRTSEAVSGVVSFETRGPGWSIAYSFYFSAENPTLDLPFIKLTPQTGQPGGGRHELSEGQLIGPLLVDYFDVWLYRDADTDRVKVMQITITKVPNE